MNLVLGDVLETIYIVDEDDEDEEIKVCSIRSHENSIYDANNRHRRSQRNQRCCLSEVGRLRGTSLINMC